MIRFCTRYKSTVESTEQAALVLCCLVEIFPQFAKVVVIV